MYPAKTLDNWGYDAAKSGNFWKTAAKARSTVLTSVPGGRSPTYTSRSFNCWCFAVARSCLSRAREAARGDSAPDELLQPELELELRLQGFPTQDH
eukprot:CAMPEP_0194553370 /NCGR_PEP_ID=MMETSP0253-20130528/97199_1 /TAXON_ID=2966 /ORGANISM="Noctiluca scintillans" /LENGTH=95 /DNA_ID=CAMNT_0039400849 /DNA_START=429 /DNA_END=716 /DNA_ORIENTATION=+